eukprot:g3772.t1
MAERGGSSYLEDFSNIISTNTNYFNNKAQYGGGIIFMNNSMFTFYECRVSGNRAKFGGAIYLQSSNISLNFVTITSNNAMFGGALYGINTTMTVTSTGFGTNWASKSGGALYLEQSNAVVTNSTMQANEAHENCGGICAIELSHLTASNLSIQFNVARNVGGGIGIGNGSSILCYSCYISNNKALRGGGMHVYSNNSIRVVAQLQNSKFENNSARSYGGGIFLFDSSLNESVSCSYSNVTCGHIILLNTNFVRNFANLYGAAIFTIHANEVLIDCDSKEGRSQDFLNPKNFSLINPSQLCKGWIGNYVLSIKDGGIVGTFGQEARLSIALDNEVKLIGDKQTRYVLTNVLGGRKLPIMYVTAVDEYGLGPAPTLIQSFGAQLWSPNGFIRGEYPTTILFGFGNFSEVAGFARPGNYTLEIEFDNPTFKSIYMIVIVRECRIGEEPTVDKLTCQDCDKLSYNFNPKKARGCKQCPNGGDCTGMFIVPKKGYWHKSPCHAQLQQCILEEACSCDNRYKTLMNITKNFTNCNFNKAQVDVYNNKLCHEGYEGPLCGSCKKSYGLSSSFECVRCGLIILSLLKMIASVCYLLFGTSLTIKGILPLASRQQTNQNEETPLLEANAQPIESAGNNRTRAENGGAISLSQIEIVPEASTSSYATHQEEDIEIIKQHLTEAFKVIFFVHC